MDAYTRALEAAITQSQSVLASHVEPGGLSERDAIDRLLSILNDERLVLTMNEQGAKSRAAAAPHDSATAERAREAGRGLARN